MNSLKAIPQAKLVTLDSLWARAAQLGKPKIEKQILGGDIEAEIMCKSAAGSTCFAKGQADNPIEALALAISEAELLTGARR